MKFKNNKSGFTLLEIIIVIIIVGVLASLALPKLFSNVAFSKSVEAVNIAGTVRRTMNSCSYMGGSFNAANCLTLAELGLPSPLYQTDEFIYTVDTTTAGKWKFIATARVASGVITFEIDETDSDLPMSKSGTLDFARIK